MSFNKLHNKRKLFMNQNKENDHIVLKGKNNVLISAPHGVSQVRLGKYKYSEIGSLTTALYLFENSNCFLIAKTQNNNDDANFDEKSKYKNSIEKLVENNKIKYISYGINKYEQAEVLEKIGIDNLAGPYISKPLDDIHNQEFLKNRSVQALNSHNDNI